MGFSGGKESVDILGVDVQADDENSFYSMQLFFRLCMFFYSALVILFMPDTLPRSAASFWSILAVLIVWNVALAYLYPRYWDREGCKCALMSADMVVGAFSLLCGGGLGNPFILYGLAPVFLIGFEVGFWSSLTSALFLSASYLASFWIKPHTITLLEHNGHAWATLVSGSLSFFIFVFVAAYIRHVVEKSQRALEKNAAARKESAKSEERARLVSETNNKLAENVGTLWRAKDQMMGARASIRKGPELPRESIEQVKLELSGAVKDSRARMKEIDQFTSSSVGDDVHRCQSARIPGRSLIFKSFIFRIFTVKGIRVRPDWRFDSLALKCLMGLRVLCILVALPIMIYGTSFLTATTFNYVLVGVALIYNLLFYLCARKATEPKLRVALVLVDLCMTALLLIGTNGYESGFFMYSFSTALLGGLWLDGLGAIAAGAGVTLAYAAALFLNGYTLGVLSAKGESGIIVDAFFHFTIAALVMALTTDSQSRLLDIEEESEGIELKRKPRDVWQAHITELHGGIVGTLDTGVLWVNILLEAENGLDYKIGKIIEIINAAIKDLERLSDEKAPSDTGLIDVGSIVTAWEADGEDGNGMQTEGTCDLPPGGVKVSHPEDLTDALKELYRNARNHAKACNLHVEASIEDHHLRIRMEDDGVGFYVAAAEARAARSGHYGIQGVREGVKRAGGTVHFDSSPGAGCRTVVRVPIE